MKNQYKGGNCLKGEGLWQFKGGLGEEEGGGVFEGVETPMHTMYISKKGLYMWVLHAIVG